MYLRVRFTGAKHYTSCGPLCRPTPACTYESSVHLVTSIISPNLDQVILYLAHTLPSVFTLWKLFQYFNRRISWFFGNFLLHHPPKFPSFSHVAILRAYVQPQMTTDFPEPLYITQKLTLTVKRIKTYRRKILCEKIHGSMEWYIALHWVTQWRSAINIPAPFQPAPTPTPSNANWSNQCLSS